MIALAAVASAATLTVTNRNDSGAGSFRQALADANAGDLIQFSTDFDDFPSPGGGDITLLSTLTVSDANVVIKGNGLVRLGCAASMTTGAALDVNANGVQVNGLIVGSCPSHGILVRQADVSIAGCSVHHVGTFGIVVSGAQAVVHDVLVDGAHTWSNCQTATGACAGIGVTRGSGSGAGPQVVHIEDSFSEAQVSGGHGIALFSGSGHAVERNQVGSTGGNAGSGIVVTASTGTVSGAIRDNLVVNNAVDGILLGVRSDHVVVDGNQVGTDGTADLGNGAVGINVFGSDLHDVIDNLVSGNGSHGIFVNGTLSGSPAESVDLSRNRVGTNAAGTGAIANGGDGIRISGNGVALNAEVVDNLVSGNTGDGIRVLGRYVTLHRNVVGLRANRSTALGNTGWGVRLGANGDHAVVDGRPGDAWEPNLVARNGTGGILASGANHVQIHDNLLGSDDARALDRGNFGIGIQVSAGTDIEIHDNHVLWSDDDGIAITGAATAVSIRRNQIRNGGASGIAITTTNAGSVAFVGNEIDDNVACPYDILATWDGNPAPPTVGLWWPWKVTGQLPTAPAGRSWSQVHVYFDEGDEAGRYLGPATITGGTWSLALADTDVPAAAAPVRRRAPRHLNRHVHRRLVHAPDRLVRRGVRDGAGRDLLQRREPVHLRHLLGGGVQPRPPEPGPHLRRREPVHHHRPVPPEHLRRYGGGHGRDVLQRRRCVHDGERVRRHGVRGRGGRSRRGLRRRRSVHARAGGLRSRARVRHRAADGGFTCEDGDQCTGLGACDALGNCADAEYVGCPGATACNACTCTPEEGCLCEGNCADDYCGPDDFFANNGEPCDECGGDGDQDGIPDAWEVTPELIDLDCDGDPDEIIPGSPNASLFDPERPTVLLQVDWMEDRPDHHHLPGDLSLLEDAFDDREIQLVAMVGTEHPHVEVTNFGGERTPKRYEGEWTTFATLKQSSFDYARRRGVFRYAIQVHQVSTSDEDNLVSRAETWGDDLVVDYTFTDGDLGDPDLAPMQDLMHELGHTLRLTHGASLFPCPSGTVLSPFQCQPTLSPPPDHLQPVPVYADGRNFQFNHLSVMDYSFGGGLLRPDNSEALDYAGVYPTGVGPTVATLETPISTAGSGHAEVDALWGWPGPIPDAQVYLAQWRCPYAGPDGNVTMNKMGPPHPPGLPSLGSGDRIMDLDCNGARRVAGNDLVTHALSLYDGSDVTEHRTINEWGALDYRFQANTPKFSQDGPYAEEGPDESGNRGVKAPWFAQEVEVYPGCASPRIPKVGVGGRVPFVMYSEPGVDLTVDRTGNLLNGAAPVSDQLRDIDCDGVDDLWLEYQVADLTHLADDAQEVSFYALRDGPDLFANVPLAGGRLAAGAAPDTDADGIHDACDACPNAPSSPGLRLPNGCPLAQDPCDP